MHNAPEGETQKACPSIVTTGSVAPEGIISVALENVYVPDNATVDG